MKTLIKLLLSAGAVSASAYILSPHVQVDSFLIAILVAENPASKRSNFKWLDLLNMLFDFAPNCY